MRQGWAVALEGKGGRRKGRGVGREEIHVPDINKDLG